MKVVKIVDEHGREGWGLAEGKILIRRGYDTRAKAIAAVAKRQGKEAKRA
jgi:hypothetical protein